MKTSTKVIIDSYAGGFAVFVLKNLFRIFSLRKSPNNGPPKTIVVCKFLGMGSIVQSTPLLQTLKKQFPDCRIIYLSSTANKNFIGQISLIDESIIINDQSLFSTIISTLSCIRLLLSKRIDLFIDLEVYSNFSKIFTIVSNARLKFGLTNDGTKAQNIYTSTFQLHTDRPVSESYLEMCKAFNSQKIIHELYSFAVDTIKLKFLLKNLEISGDYIVVNPNASDLRIERRWPQENFSELINKIVYQFRIERRWPQENFSELINKIVYAYPENKIVLIGSSAESNYVNNILAGINPSLQKSIINTAGRLSIDELIALISGTKLMITNDTGPMHLSFAMKCRTLALFGPASPLQFGNHKNATSVYKKVSCSPCVHDHIKPPCGGDNICMKGIGVEEVFEEVVNCIEVKGQGAKVIL